jgi:hypothetical protein
VLVIAGGILVFKVGGKRANVTVKQEEAA